MKNRWKGAAVAITIASALTLTACSNPSAGGTTSQQSGSGEWPSVSTKLSGTTLTIWAAQTSNQYAASVIKGFEQLTGAKVVVQTIPDPYEQSIQTKIQTGDKPDLAFWQPTASELTLLNPSTNLQSLDGAPWLSKYTSDTIKNIGDFNGHHYSAVISTPSVEGIYYNKQVFEKAGITSTPKNFADMVADAKTLKSKGITPFYEAGKDQWPTQWWVSVQLADAAKKGLWTRINDNKEAFTSPTVLDAIKNYDDLINEGYFNSDIKSGTFVNQGAELLSGQVAMVDQINALFGELQTEASTSELNQKIGWFPISPEGNTATFIPDQSNALVAFNTGNSKQEAASRQFLEYWLGEGYPNFVKSLNTVSIEKGVSTPSTVPTTLKDVAASIPDAAGSMQVLAVANPDLYLYLSDMIAGTKTPLQVAQATQAQFAQQAKAQGVKAYQ